MADPASGRRVGAAMTVPERPRIYHIVHVDRLPEIIRAAGLFCDAEIVRRQVAGTQIGMSEIKARRLNELRLASHPELFVGDCVPFYFCPRSIMLYVLHRGNHRELTYHGGQEPIIHLEADLHTVVAWADREGYRWAFTLSNAGARYFEDRCSLDALGEIDWTAVQTNSWGGGGLGSLKEGKQAEFLLESFFPWRLVERIGVYSNRIFQKVTADIHSAAHKPPDKIIKEWYY